MSNFVSSTSNLGSTAVGSSAEKRDEVEDQFEQKIRSDFPTIYDSVKNLIALLVAKSYDNKDSHFPCVSSSSAMLCGKALLQAVQACELPTMEQFTAAHPQSDTQSGMSRLDEVIKYKTVWRMRQAALQHPGAKVSRLFGRKYFLWTQCWDSVRLIAVEKLCGLSATIEVPTEESAFFFDTYSRTLVNDESSLSGDGYGDAGLALQPSSLSSSSSSSTTLTTVSASNSKSGSGSGSGNGDSRAALVTDTDGVELVWAADFAGALAARQRRRAELVRERMELMELSEQCDGSTTGSTNRQEPGKEQQEPRQQEQELQVEEQRKVAGLEGQGAESAT